METTFLAAILDMCGGGVARPEPRHPCHYDGPLARARLTACRAHSAPPRPIRTALQGLSRGIGVLAALAHTAFVVALDASLQLLGGEVVVEHLYALFVPVAREVPARGEPEQIEVECGLGHPRV